MRDATTIIHKPLVTEKNMSRVEAQNTYTFEVDCNANKIEIRRAIEELYKVRVVRVNTILRKGKERRFGAHLTRTPTVKRALVTLADGFKIEIL